MQRQPRSGIRERLVSLRMHVAPHPDTLVDLLCQQLALPPEDVFAAEAVAVPTRGIERWLTQQIASGLAAGGAGDGVCANVDFPSPGRLVRRVMRAVPALDRSVEAWEGPVATSHLLNAVDASLGEPWMRLIARHLDTDGPNPGSRRLAAATRIHRLYSRYARRRPEMIRRWQAGEDVGPTGEPLDGDWVWQPRLWRRLRAAVGVASLAELMPDALEPVRQGTAVIDLPDRLAVYGLTATDPLDLEVLVALSAQRQVHLYVLHPSPALWKAAEDLPAPAVLPVRREDPIAALAVNPLLAAWGRDSRELQTILAAHGLEASEVITPEFAPTTMLERLQDSIRGNRAPEASPADPDDRSVQIHVCHGPRRQAEVMRDAVLHILSNDPSLEPRDIVIMTPDLTTFAPLLEAAFPQGETGGLPDLRLRIADRSLAATNPLVGFAAHLVAVADSRLEADAVRDLVTRPLVQNRFGFDADTAGSIVTLIDDARVAWGIDAGDRERWGVHDRPERTWLRGIDRALVGVFYADSPVRTVGGIAPLEGIEGQEATPAGILAAILDRLVAVRTLLGKPMPLSQWAGSLGNAVRTLAAPAWGEEWQLDQLERLLSETFPPDAELATGAPLVSLSEIRSALAAWADDRPSPLFFRTGDVTVCTLAPMRSVPYRVVCLLGMDDARFPRRGRTDGDDLLTDHEIIGDHDPSAADRQLLLDAVMAAGDYLVITYAGRDQLTSSRFPPAVPVAELQDALTDMLGEDVTGRVIADHPLQSFSAVNFDPDAGLLSRSGPWGFDPMQLQGAAALTTRPTTAPPKPITWPRPPDPDTVRLADLIALLQDPPGRFLRSRVGFAVPEAGEVPDDTLPVELGSLERWSVTDQILTGLLFGHDLDQLAGAQLAGDSLPPGDLGSAPLRDAAEAAVRLWEAATALDFDPSRHQPWAGVIETALAPLEGTVTADPERHHLATVTASRLGPKQRLKAFTELLFLTALAPDLPWQAVLLGKRPSGNGFLSVTLGPLPGEGPDRRSRAVEILTSFIDLYLEGLRRPLPLPLKTGYAWQRGLRSDRGRAAARQEFADRFGERNDPAFRLVLPHITDWDSLEASGFVDHAAAVWLPMLPLFREKNL